VNALRGHLAEFGVIAPQGLRNVGKLIAIVRDEDDARLPDLARQVMRPRFADPIRASSPPGLHQQAGHMTASDLCAARQMISCQAGAIHT
jgi:hypothetical protein